MTLRQKLLLAFGILGLAASSMSSYVHYRLLTDPSYTSFCDVSSTVNCTQAYLSPYGTLWGVPVALAGVLYFVLILFLIVADLRGKPATRESATGYIFLLSTIGLAVVLYLAWASYVQLHTVCLFCATTYVAVIAIFVMSGGALRIPLTTLPSRAPDDARSLGRSPMALVVLLLLLGGVAAAIGWFPRESAASAQEQAIPPLTDEQRAALEKWWKVQKKIDLPIPDEGAKVLIVKFSDYMCPACRQTYRVVQARARKIPRRRPGPLRRQALPARSGMQSERSEQPLRVLRGGRGRRDGAVRPAPRKNSSSGSSRIRCR